MAELFGCLTGKRIWSEGVMAELESVADAKPVILKHRRTALERVEKFISEIYFTDCNLWGRWVCVGPCAKTVPRFVPPARFKWCFPALESGTIFKRLSCLLHKVVQSK